MSVGGGCGGRRLKEKEREGEIKTDGVSRPPPPVGVGGVCGGLTRESERERQTKRGEREREREREREKVRERKRERNKNKSGRKLRKEDNLGKQQKTRKTSAATPRNLRPYHTGRGGGGPRRLAAGSYMYVCMYVVYYILYPFRFKESD